MEPYLLSILGSSVDYFYEADSYPEEGDFSHARFSGISAGGCPLNVAAVAAAKGRSVKVLDMLGKDDDTTFFLLSEMKRLKLNTGNIIIRNGVRNGKVLIIITREKRTMFVIDPVRQAYEINEKITKLLNNATYIYSLMHMINRSFDSIEPLIQAKRNGARIIFDGTSKYDDPLRVKMLYELCDGLFINKTDYGRLEAASKDDPKKILFEKGAEFIIITDGAKGSTLYLKDSKIFMPAIKGIAVVDSTGAGDSFAGCFLSCLLSGMDYEKALKYATVNGAYACSIFGSLGGVSSYEQLEDFARRYNYEI